MSVFSTELITFELNATDKVDAISQMAKMVVAAGRGSDAEQITKDVLARDEMGTPQVDGVANHLRHHRQIFGELLSYPPK